MVPFPSSPYMLHIPMCDEHLSLISENFFHLRSLHMCKFSFSALVDINMRTRTEPNAGISFCSYRNSTLDTLSSCVRSHYVLFVLGTHVHLSFISHQCFSRYHHSVVESSSCSVEAKNPNHSTRAARDLAYSIFYASYI